MFKSIEESWNGHAAGYDYLIQRQLGNYRCVTYWSGILEKLIGPPPKRVLEIGCGPGFLSLLMSRLGYTVKAVDGSEEMLAAARRNFSRYECDVDTLLEDGVLLPEEKPESFDAIVSRDVVWNLYDPMKALARWKELLRPGGKVIYFDGDYRFSYNHGHPVGECFSNLLKMVLYRDKTKPTGKTVDENNVFLQLPLLRRKRPREDRDMLIRTGFIKIRILSDRYRNSPVSTDFWTYGYQGKKFIAVAWKGRT